MLNLVYLLLLLQSIFQRLNWAFKVLLLTFIFLEDVRVDVSCLLLFAWQILWEFIANTELELIVVIDVLKYFVHSGPEVLDVIYVLP